MTRYDFGDIVVVKFPFTNQTEFKQRPAVVLSNQYCNSVKPDMILMAITSQLRPVSAFGDLCIGEWKAAQLMKPSAIKPVIVKVEQSLIICSLGKLQPADKSALRTMLQTVLG